MRGEYERTDRTGPGDSVLEGIQICELDIAESFWFVVSILDDFDRLCLRKGDIKDETKEERRSIPFLSQRIPPSLTLRDQKPNSRQKQ